MSDRVFTRALFPLVTAVSIIALPLPGTYRPQPEPGLKPESWHHLESSSLSSSLVGSFTWMILHLNKPLFSNIKYSTFLFLSSPVWDSLKMPLLYGAAASLGNVPNTHSRVKAVFYTVSLSAEYRHHVGGFAKNRRTGGLLTSGCSLLLWEKTTVTLASKLKCWGLNGA